MYHEIVQSFFMGLANLYPRFWHTGKKWLWTDGPKDGHSFDKICTKNRFLNAGSTAITNITFTNIDATAYIDDDHYHYYRNYYFCIVSSKAATAAIIAVQILGRI